MPQMLMLDVSIFGLNDEGWKVKWDVLKRMVVSKPCKGHNQCVLEKDILCVLILHKKIITVKFNKGFISTQFRHTDKVIWYGRHVIYVTK